MTYLVYNQHSPIHQTWFVSFQQLTGTIVKNRQGVQDITDFFRFPEEEVQLRHALTYHGGFLQS